MQSVLLMCCLKRCGAAKLQNSSDTGKGGCHDLHERRFDDEKIYRIASVQPGTGMPTAFSH